MTHIASALAALLLAAGCTVPNAEHCLHQKPNGHAWCIDRDRTRTFCSPCAAAHDGCVAQPPTGAQCPEYEPPPGESDTGSGSEGGTGATTETGSGSDTTTAADPDGGAAPR